MFGLTKRATYVIDFETLADGRVTSLVDAGLLTGRVIVPDLELYSDANHALLERAESTLKRFREARQIKVRVIKQRLAGEELIRVARKNRGRAITVSRDLASGPEVPVTRIDALHESLKPVYLPGAELKVKVVKRGKEADEGIAYLEGGIKVVIDDGAHLVGKEAEVVIVGALDTQVGRVVFARPRYTTVK